MSILKLGPLIVGNSISLCCVNITVSTSGLLINLVIQKVEFFCMFAGNGLYNFNIIEFISSSGFTNSLPNSSTDFLDNVQLSFSQDEIIVCSSLPKFARCVKYLLSLSGDNPKLLKNASNTDFLIISSSTVFLTSSTFQYVWVNSLKCPSLLLMQTLHPALQSEETSKSISRIKSDFNIIHHF